MKKIFDTHLGKVTVTTAIIDVNGTDLCTGVDFNLNDKFIGDAVSLFINDVNKDNIENLIERYCII